MYDVIVVGAGPAGASAAYWLREAGKRVLVLERELLPRYKACGGAVPLAALEGFPFSFDPVVDRTVRRARFRFRDGREVALDLPGRPVAMVMRERFDLHILSQAGADVRDGCAVVSVIEGDEGVQVVTQSGEAYRGSYLIGADGANSRIARAVGLRSQKYVGGSIEVELDAAGSAVQPDEDTALFLFGSPPFGYQWVFPKAAHLSAGIGAFAASGANLKETLSHTVTTLGMEVDGSQLHGHPLPVYCRHERLQKGRVLLAGDAAALMDPLIGEGIRHAIDSGRLAAEAISEERVAGYTASVQREIGDDLLWGLRWARPFYGFPEASFEFGVRNPRFVYEFLKLFAGETTYRKIALSAPGHILKGTWRRLPLSQTARH